MDVTNKSLAMFLVAAIVVSLGGTIISLNRLGRVTSGPGPSTGYVTSLGNATLNILTSSSVVFAIQPINFGAGNVNSSQGNTCTMFIWNNASIYQSGCTGFNRTNDAGDTFIIMNNGNTLLNISLNSTANVSGFIGGDATVAAFWFNVTNNETNSCTSGFERAQNWTNVSTQDPYICDSLDYTIGKRSLRIGVKVIIPLNATQGAKTATFTVTGNVP